MKIMVVGGGGREHAIIKKLKENKNITRDVLGHFMNKTGTDMGNIDRELEKLICYTEILSFCERINGYTI